MPWDFDGQEFGLDLPASALALGRPPDRIVIVSDWLTEVGGGVNTVMKHQIDYLSRLEGLQVVVLVEGGDYQPQPLRWS